jgi:hypothetical protein
MAGSFYVKSTMLLAEANKASATVGEDGVSGVDS